MSFKESLIKHLKESLKTRFKESKIVIRVKS